MLAGTIIKKHVTQSFKQRKKNLQSIIFLYICKIINTI